MCLKEQNVFILGEGWSYYCFILCYIPKLQFETEIKIRVVYPEASTPVASSRIFSTTLYQMAM